jgi:sugar O-acyltransferase (sialic acid O-acetyltransferase NeuD family)
MRDLILIGGGGHCSSVIDSIRAKQEYNIIGIIDITNNIGKQTNGVSIIGTDDNLADYYSKGITSACITVGSVASLKFRQSLYTKASQLGFSFPSIIDPTAIISPNAVIDEGVYVGKGAIINAGAHIGAHCIINTGAIIEHGCKIGLLCHIAPGAVLSGEVVVGERTHIGTNATVIQQVTIGHDVLIGAGSVVVSHIDSNKKAYGNPCREAERNGHE